MSEEGNEPSLMDELRNVDEVFQDCHSLSGDEERSAQNDQEDQQHLLNDRDIVTPEFELETAPSEPFPPQEEGYQNETGGLPINDPSVLPDEENEHESDQKEEASRLLVTPVQGQLNEDVPQMDGGHYDSFAAPPSEVASDNGIYGLRGGFTIRNYEEEVTKLKRDNLSLRLRIYFLEERIGLNKMPQEKENVYRINLNLQVENESMKKELEDKTQLLKAAYEAMENQEKERLRERNEFESRIESLRQSLFDSQMNQTNLMTFNSKSQENGIRIFNKTEYHQSYDAPKEDVSNGAASENSLNEVNVGDQTKGLLVDAFGSFSMGKSEDLLTKFEELEKNCAEQKERIQELEEDLKRTQKIAEEREDDFSRETEAFDKMTREFRGKISLLEREVSSKEEELSRAKEEFQHKLREGMKEKESENIQLRESLNEIQSKYDDKVDTLQKELKKTKEDMSLMEECVQGVVEAKLTLGETNKKMEKELKRKDAALAKLTEEYEKIKNKIREYRAQGLNNNSQSNKTECSERNHDNDTEAIQKALEKEIMVLKQEIARSKAKARKEGADAALKKAKSVFAGSAQEYSQSVHAIMSMLRQRLIELIEFLQKLLSSTPEDNLDTSMREALQKSLEESRRLSQSLSRSVSMQPEDLNETQLSELHAECEIPNFEIPEVEITFDKEEQFQYDNNYMKDFEALVEELKDNVNRRVQVEKTNETLTKELSVLKDKLDYEQFSRPLMRSRSASRTRLNDKHTDTQTYQTARDDSDAWSQPDKHESRKRLGIYTKQESKSDSSRSDQREDEIKRANGKILQLKARLASIEERSQLERSLTSSKLEETQKLVSILKKEKKDLTDQLALVKKDLDDNIASLVEELNKVVAENKRIVSKNRSLKKQLEQREIEAFKQQQDEIELYDKLRNELNTERENIARLSKQYRAHEDEIKKNLHGRLESLMEELKHLKEENVSLRNDNEMLSKAAKEALEKSHHSHCSRAVFVSKENFEEHELALGKQRDHDEPRRPLSTLSTNHSQKMYRLSMTSQCCDCEARIEELERLLKETRNMYDEAQQKIQEEKFRREKIQKGAKKELEKSKKVLKQTKAIHEH